MTCGVGRARHPRPASARRGPPVELTAFEYRLLEYLMLRAGQVVSKAELTEKLYEQDFERDSNTIEVFIGRLRRKLDPDDQLSADRDAARARLPGRSRLIVAPPAPSLRCSGSCCTLAALLLVAAAAAAFALD